MGAAWARHAMYESGLRDDQSFGVLENGVLGRIFWSRELVIGICRRLYNYELHGYYSQNIREINTRRIILIGHSARMITEKFVYSNEWRTWKAEHIWVFYESVGRMPLKLIWKKFNWRLWTGFIGIGTGRKVKLLWKRFHTRWQNSSLAEWPVASQEWLFTAQLVHNQQNMLRFL